MKKQITALILVSLILALGVGVRAEGANPTERFAGRWQDPAYGRAMLRIMLAVRDDAAEGEIWYDGWMTWGDSADSEGRWTMSMKYDAASDSLVYQDGAMSIVTWDTAGKVASEEVLWEGAEGSFTLAGGTLLWSDSREERASDFAFAPVEKSAPSEAEFRERYFLPLAQWPRETAGSSLKLAGICADIIALADEYCIWDGDIPTLRGNMLRAWEALDDETRANFDGNLPEAMALMDAAFEDYASVAGQFEDAGCEAMEYLARDREAVESWRTLIANTWTMGNAD